MSPLPLPIRAGGLLLRVVAVIHRGVSAGGDDVAQVDGPVIDEVVVTGVLGHDVGSCGDAAAPGSALGLAV